MSNFFGAGSGRVNKPVLPATALRVQSSANGIPIPFLHGRNRVAGNMLDYEGFTATPVSNPSAGGGKGGVLGGGGKGSQQPTSYTYSTNIIFGLCEGAIALILRVWNNKTATTPAGLNFTGFAGSIGQAVWSWWEASYPNTALGYSALAYVAANPINLGTSPEMANLTWEVQSVIGNAVVEFHALSPGGGQSFTPSYFSLADATTEQVTIPAASPYQIQAQNPTAVTALPVIDGAVIASPLTNSAGVIYTATGAAFTRVSGTPSVGQYSVTQTGLYTFAAADAGEMVTIIDLAIGQAQYIEQPTGDTVLGDPIITGLSATVGIAQGQLVTGAGIAAGTTVLNAIGAGTFTGNTHAGTTLVDGLSAGASPVVGSLIQDSAGAVPSNATIAAVTPAAIVLDQNAQADAPGDSIFFGFLCSGNVSPGNAAITGVSPTIGITIGQGFDDAGGAPLGSVFPATATVIGISGSTVTMSAPAINSSSGEFYFTAIVTADLAIGGATLMNVSSTALIGAGMEIIFDAAGALPNGGTIQLVTSASFNLSLNATASSSGDNFSYPAQVTVSPAPIATATGVTLTFWGQNLIQVIGNPGPGQFSINVYQDVNYGQYVFGDTSGSVAIVDVPDADPSASAADFLTNPRYGCGFPAANLGDLSLLQNYAYATGLFISPAIVASQAANSYLQDFSTGLNGEFVWSAGLLTFVPYGDAALTGNGRTYTPPVAAGPIYALTDDDYLPNEGTTSIGVSAFTSDDPVVCVRKRQSDALNDVKVEYLDRGNSYNPAIVEAKDDAAINLFGLRPADTKTLHFFCTEAAALQSAQLQLGRQQIRNEYSFTVPWYFILLDPMDIIAITDAALGLDAQLVRILEITENQEDWSLTLTAEEVLDGTGAAPQYGTQIKAGYTANYNLAPGTPVAPVIFEPPVQIAESGGLEVWLLTGAAADYGGADVYVSSDGATYKLAGRIGGGASRVGVTTADFPAGSDPDTSDTLSVDLTATAGTLLSGTQADADRGHTLCVVGGYPYAAAPSLSAVAGGSLAGATYYARATYVFASGEGPSSPEESIEIAASALLVAASPTPQNGAIGWNIYVGLAPGAETLQNAVPIAIGTGWTEPTSGLLAGAAPPPAETGYELVSYETAILTAQYKYSLGTYLRRGLYGSTVSDHPAGSSFARIDGTQLVYAYDKGQIGQTIFFKLTPFNQWGGGEPDLASVQPYAHTLEGPPAPGTVTGFSAQQSGGAVIFAWNDLSGDGFLAYDLLYGPQGASVASATFLTQAGRGTEMTNASVPPGAWIFYIRGHDTLSGLVGPPSSVNLTIANLNAIIVSAGEAPDWLGAMDGFLLHYSGVLVPDSTMLAHQLTNAQLFESFVAYPVANPTYTCVNVLDTGLVGNFRLWASWAASAGGNNANESGEISFQLDAWQSSDPAAYAPWGNTGIVTSQRYARGRIVEHTAVPAFISALSVTADSPVATYAIPSLAVASSGTTLIFASTAAAPPLPAQFHTPPTVQVTPNAGTAITGTATSVSDTACVVTLYDATGTAVAGTASIIIAGA